MVTVNPNHLYLPDFEIYESFAESRVMDPIYTRIDDNTKLSLFL
jgi:hypothetical protein